MPMIKKIDAERFHAAPEMPEATADQQDDEFAEFTPEELQELEQDLDGLQDSLNDIWSGRRADREIREDIRSLVQFALDADHLEALQLDESVIHRLRSLRALDSFLIAHNDVLGAINQNLEQLSAAVTEFRTATGLDVVIRHDAADGCIRVELAEQSTQEPGAAPGPTGAATTSRKRGMAPGAPALIPGAPGGSGAGCANAGGSAIDRKKRKRYNWLPTLEWLVKSAACVEISYGTINVRSVRFKINEAGLLLVYDDRTSPSKWEDANRINPMHVLEDKIGYHPRAMYIYAMISRYTAAELDLTEDAWIMKSGSKIGASIVAIHEALIMRGTIQP